MLKYYKYIEQHTFNVQLLTSSKLHGINFLNYQATERADERATFSLCHKSLI